MFDLVWFYARPLVASLVIMVLYGYLRALVSFKLGDKSGEVKSRLTLDPREHLDVIGTIMTVFLSLGFIKPMRNSVMYFENRKRDMILVAVLPGFLVTLIATVIVYIFTFLGIRNGIVFGVSMLNRSLLFWIYNLIPIFPLDGEKILTAVGSPNIRMKMSEYSNIATMILILLTFMGIVGDVVSVIVKYLMALLLILL